MTVIMHRRGTAANWTSANPILRSGEIGFEIDTGMFKIGDGGTNWTNLTYHNPSSRVFSGGVDLNTIRIPGQYNVGYHPNNLNTPLPDGGLLIVSSTNDSGAEVVVQTFVQHGGAEVSTLNRKKTPSGWSAWSSETTRLITAHEGMSNPHPQYAQSGGRNVFTDAQTIKTSGSGLTIERQNATDPNAAKWSHYTETNGFYYLTPTASNGSPNGKSVIFDRNGSMQVGGVWNYTGTGNPNGVAAYNGAIGSTFTNTEAGGYNGVRAWRKTTTAANSWVVEYGDTGWRDLLGSEGSLITPTNWDVENTLGPALKIRRINHNVYFQIRLKTSSQLSGATVNGSYNILSLPLGFVCDGNVSVGTAMLNATRSAGVFSTQMSQAIITFSPDHATSQTTFNNSSLLSGSAQFTTTNAWPTVLPGTSL